MGARARKGEMILYDIAVNKSDYRLLDYVIEVARDIAYPYNKGYATKNRRGKEQMYHLTRDCSTAYVRWKLSAGCDGSAAEII